MTGVNTEPIAVVYDRHQHRLFAGLVKPENIITFRSLYLLKDRRPEVIFRTGLGKSAPAWRMLEALESLAWDTGAEIVHERQLGADAGTREVFIP